MCITVWNNILISPKMSIEPFGCAPACDQQLAAGPTVVGSHGSCVTVLVVEMTGGFS